MCDIEQSTPLEQEENTLCGLVVRISRYTRGGRGSIPRTGSSSLLNILLLRHPIVFVAIRYNFAMMLLAYFANQFKLRLCDIKRVLTVSQP